MHAFIITQGNSETRNHKIQNFLSTWKIHSLDVLEPEPEEKAGSIGIGPIRQFISRLNHKPLKSASTVGLIKQAQLLTTQAQNALLKTLEEPPGKAKIILASPNEDILLPTIRSRCQIVRLAASEILPDSKFKAAFFAALYGSPASKLAYVDTLDKDNVSSWCEETLAVVAEELGKSTSGSQLDINIQKKLPQLAHQLIAIAPFLRLNISPKLLLDSLLLGTFPLQGGTLQDY